MKKTASEMSVYDMVMAGLEDSIAFSKGTKPLVTTRVPAPPPPMDAPKIIKLRNDLKMTQGRFAAALNVSSKTVQGWEQGLRTPGNASLRLLQIVEQQAPVVLAVVCGAPCESFPAKRHKTGRAVKVADKS